MDKCHGRLLFLLFLVLTMFKMVMCLLLSLVFFVVDFVFPYSKMKVFPFEIL
jgi:hypothetical protein